MKANQLIKELNKLIHKHGDLPITVCEEFTAESYFADESEAYHVMHKRKQGGEILENLPERYYVSTKNTLHFDD
jgi:hypothetical protein